MAARHIDDRSPKGRHMIRRLNRQCKRSVFAECVVLSAVAVAVCAATTLGISSAYEGLADSADTQGKERLEQEVAAWHDRNDSPDGKSPLYIKRLSAQDFVGIEQDRQAEEEAARAAEEAAATEAEAAAEAEAEAAAAEAAVTPDGDGDATGEEDGTEGDGAEGGDWEEDGWEEPSEE